MTLPRFKVYRAVGQTAKQTAGLFWWMGCKLAVYEFTVQAKAEKRAERSGARRSTKRRGGRSGRRNARKSRRLVTADPGSIEPSRPQGKVVSKTFTRPVNAYRRRIDYEQRLLKVMVHLRKVGFNPNSAYGPSRKKRYWQIWSRLVDVMSRTSQDSPEFVRLRLRTILKVMSLGWDALSAPAHVSGSDHPSNSVPPPDPSVWEDKRRRPPRKAPNLAGKNSDNVAKAPVVICRLCGYVGTQHHCTKAPGKLRRRGGEKGRVRRCGCKVGAKCPH